MSERRNYISWWHKECGGQLYSISAWMIEWKDRVISITKVKCSKCGFECNPVDMPMERKKQ